MLKAPIPSDDALRVSALRALQLLDSPREERFDRLTRLARRLFGVPVALVSMVDADRQWFKSAQGLDVTETPRDVSFCGHAIAQEGPLVVPDAFADERFFDNPLVTGDPHVRFYAGCTLSSPGSPHRKLGTLCLIDHQPRTFSPDDLAALRDLADMVEREIAALGLATLDSLTGLSNRLGFNALAGHALALAARQEAPVSMAFIDLDGFKAINDQHGHAAGDQALTEIAGILLHVFRSSDVIARLGGDEFGVLLVGAADLHRPLNALREAVEARNAAASTPWPLAYSIGTATRGPQPLPVPLDALVAEADAAMYASKARHRRERDSLG